MTFAVKKVLRNRWLHLLALGLLGACGGKSGTVETPLPVEPDQVVCTMEVKICPDGTGVGRLGPRCEFASCPASSSSP
jgi:hypothetical protein